jgi:mono/diheme cytochrome c family protein
MRRPVHATLILGLALALSSACGGGSEQAPAPEPEAAAPVEPEPEPAALPAEPAAEPAAEAAAGPGDAAAGAPLYATYCASCHGPKGDGDGPVSAGLNPKPAKHSDAAYMTALSDEHLFKVVKEGGASVGKSPLMAPWGGTLSDAQIRDVVAFVRTLAH